MGLWDVVSMVVIVAGAAGYVWKKTFGSKNSCGGCSAADGCSLKDLKRKNPVIIIKK